MSANGEDKEDKREVSRRGVLARSASAVMAGGLAASYGSFAAIAARYLYPARPPETEWLYVTEVATMKVGASTVFETPSGARAAIARRAENGDADDFIALSSTCPHLGCQVHWEPGPGHFFCPCHNGTFDPSGKATAGPPAESGQSLPRYPLKVAGGLLYIEVPLAQLASRSGSRPAGAPPGAGHDPCLFEAAKKVV